MSTCVRERSEREREIKEGKMQIYWGEIGEERVEGESEERGGEG